MPTVPIEQNRVGIASLTDEKLKAADLSGTGLQALGAGFQMLDEGGAKFADAVSKLPPGGSGQTPPQQGSRPRDPDPAEVQQRREPEDGSPHDPQLLYDDAASKMGWNQFAVRSREILSGFEARKGFDALATLESTAEALREAFEQGRAALTTDRQRGIYDQSVGPRLTIDMERLQTLANAQNGVEQSRQSTLVQNNSADDAVTHADDPALFARYMATGIESILTQGALRGENPAITHQAEAVWRSRIHLRVADGLIAKEPATAAAYLLAHQDEMTAPDQLLLKSSLFEPLAHARAAADVDSLTPPQLPGAPTPFTPEERDVQLAAIEKSAWDAARKRYARDELAGRILTEDRQRKQVAEKAKEAALVAADQLGPDFTSLTQLAAAIRRDLDAATTGALVRRATNNLDPRPVSPQGLTALKLNLMATYQPAEFARQDLRLAKDLMAPEEYDALVRRKQAMDSYPPGPDAVTQQRAVEAINNATVFDLATHREAPAVRWFGLSAQARGSDKWTAAG